MTMHWTIRTLLVPLFLASLALAAQVQKEAEKDENTEASSRESLNNDISGPEQKVISIGNVDHQDATKIAVAASVVHTGIWTGLLLVIAEFIKGIGARIYPVPEGQGDQEYFDDNLNLVWKGRKAARPRQPINILEWVLAGFDSINSRLLDEERETCKKMTLCQLGTVTSGYSFVHSFLEVIRPAVPMLDTNWDGLIAGEARENCNAIYERCPIGILSAFFRPSNPPPTTTTSTTTTTTSTTSTTELPPHISTLTPH